MNDQDLNTYIKKVVEYSFEANKYFNDLEPWAIKKENPERMRTILYTAVEQIKNISILLNPVIPIATNKVFHILNLNEKDMNLKNIQSDDLFNFDKEINKIDILFKKIENDN